MKMHIDRKDLGGDSSHRGSIADPGSEI